jgi:hypothetical protein
MKHNNGYRYAYALGSPYMQVQVPLEVQLLLGC